MTSVTQNVEVHESKTI